MKNTNTSALSWDDFMKVEMRVGTIIKAKTFEAARHPAYKIIIDFGAFGIRKTSAQLTKRYTASQLIGKQVVAVVNFPPKQIATMMSECLLLGAMGPDKDVILIKPESKAENGLRIG